MFGPRSLGSTGERIQVLANNNGVIWTPGGMTLAWPLVAALGADIEVNNGMIVQAGNKYLRYGQVMCKVTEVEVQTITVANATGGTFDIAGVNAITGIAFEITEVPYNVTVADLQALFNAAVGSNDEVLVSSTGAGVFVITFRGSWGNVDAMTVDDTNITGGGTESATIAQTTAGSAYAGLYGPYDPTATDGRQNLNRGDCWILNETVLYQPLPGVPRLPNQSDVIAGLAGSRLYVDRIRHSGTAAHSLELGPTYAELIAAFPDLIPVWL